MYVLIGCVPLEDAFMWPSLVMWRVSYMWGNCVRTNGWEVDRDGPQLKGL